MAAITQPPQGITEGFGIALEHSTGTPAYGVAVSPDIWWRPVSNTLRRKDPWRSLSGPTGFAQSMTTTRGFRGVPDVSGTVVLEAEYDDIGWLIVNAIGPPTGAGAVTDTTAYTHTFNWASTIPTTIPTSFTAARVNGLEDLQYTGCMINAIEFSGAGDRLVTVSMDIVGQSGGAIIADDAAENFSTAPFVEFHDSILRADFGSTGTALSATEDQKEGAEALDWTVRLENGYRFIPATTTAGGVRGIRVPTFGGYRRAFMRLSRDFFNDDFFDQYHSATLAGAFGTFGLACFSDELAGSSTAAYGLEFRFTAGHINDTGQEFPGGPEVLGETIEIECGYDGSNLPAFVQIINQTATYVIA